MSGRATRDARDWHLETRERTDDCVKLVDFAMKFAAQANIEWRVVFAKLGSITESDLDGESFFSTPGFSYT